MDILDRVERNLDRAAKLHARIAARDLRFEAEMKAIKAKTAKSDARFKEEMKAIKDKSARNTARFKEEMKAIKDKSARNTARFKEEMKAIEAEIAKSNARIKASEASRKAIEAETARNTARFEKEIKAIKDETARSDARFEEEMKAHRKKMAKLDAKIKKCKEETAKCKRETAKCKRETAKHQKAVTRYKKAAAEYWEQQHKQEAVRQKEWEALKKMVGGIGETQGQIAEDFFYQALLKARGIGGIPFEDIRSNVRVRRRDKRAEYDLVMENGKFVAIVEIKQRLRETDVEKVHAVLMPNARYLLRELHGKTLVPVVAGMTVDEGAVALAHNYGYAVLTPNGQQVRTDTTHLRCIPCDA